MVAREAVPWQYRVVTFKNPEVGHLQARLDALGAAGWELVTLSTTVKTWLNVTGNDLVAVFKRPASGEIVPDPVPESDGTF